MHVALYAPSWPLGTYPNGIVTYVHWMRVALRAQGHRVSIFTGTLDAPEPEVHLVTPGIGYRARAWLHARIAPLESPVLPWGRAIAAKVGAVHDADPIDVLEMEESFGWFADVASRLPIPVVVKLHGPAFLSLVEEELSTPLAAAKIAAEGKALQRAQVVTSPANATLDATVERYRMAPAIARHIVNPLTLPTTAWTWQLDRCDRKNLLFVGRFDKRKGGDIVLSAFARLLHDDPSLTLTFAGPDVGIAHDDGTIERADAFRARLFTADQAARVTFTGRLAAEEIHVLRARAFATIVASRWENQSYTLVEAMLQGCPVVSSDTGGQGELIEDGVTGLLCAPGDAVDLAAKLAQLLQNPPRATTMGSAARVQALDVHSPTNVATRTLAVYEAAKSPASRLAVQDRGSPVDAR